MTPLPAASVEGFLNPEHRPAYAGPVGAVEGVVRVTGDPAPAVKADFSRCPEGAAVYGRAFREGAPLADGSRPVSDALVAVTGQKGFFPETKEAKTVRFQRCAITPRAIDVTLGQRIDVFNDDTRLHTPSLVETRTRIVRAAPPKGEAVPLYPEKAGFDRIIDETGPRFIASEVYVLLHPHHTTTGVDGAYRIDGLPPGDVQVNVHVTGLRDVVKPVTIAAGQTVRLDVTVENRGAK